ncbi:chaperonin 10-like protein [Bisporella sp. PMI_857]|nr:chaperonin 10-like protein [Bisporella sp. PMI_857]
MAQRENKAAWIVEEKDAFKIGPTLYPEPDSHEIVIRAQATSIQPADAKITKAAALKFQYPTILGSPIAGFVEAIGSEVTKVKIGERVIGETPFPAAVVTASQTSFAALFAKTGLDLKRPTDPLNPEPNGERILIWGGSSAMGALSINYAKSAGYTVITTASLHNFPLLKSLGADHIFSRLPDIETTVASIGALDQSEKDAIDLLVLLPPTYPPFPDNVEPRMSLFRSSLIENKGFVQWMLGGNGEKGYLEKGYEEGRIKGVPAEVIGGLNAVEDGITRLWEGRVSAKKIVVEPWAEN